MTSNVTQIPIDFQTTGPVPVEDVINGAHEVDLQTVNVIGVTEENNMYLALSDSNATSFVGLLAEAIDVVSEDILEVAPEDASYIAINKLAQAMIAITNGLYEQEE